MAATYAQIADHYRRKIEAGELKQGERLPAVREIAETWGVAKATADRAVAQLKADGLVRTGKGSIGTVVDAKPSETVSVAIGGLAHGVKVASAEVVTATEQMAIDLGVRVGSAVVVVRLNTEN